MKINLKAFAFAGALTYGLLVFLTTLWLTVRNLQGEQIFFHFIYPGYSISGFGSIIGLLYGLVDGAVVCLILGALYNYIIEQERKDKPLV